MGSGWSLRHSALPAPAHGSGGGRAPAYLTIPFTTALPVGAGVSTTGLPETPGLSVLWSHARAKGAARRARTTRSRGLRGRSFPLRIEGPPLPRPRAALEIPARFH